MFWEGLARKKSWPLQRQRYLFQICDQHWCVGVGPSVKVSNVRHMNELREALKNHFEVKAETIKMKKAA